MCIGRPAHTSSSSREVCVLCCWYCQRASRASPVWGSKKETKLELINTNSLNNCKIQFNFNCAFVFVGMCVYGYVCVWDACVCVCVGMRVCGLCVWLCVMCCCVAIANCERAHACLLACKKRARGWTYPKYKMAWNATCIHMYSNPNSSPHTIKYIKQLLTFGSR